MGLFLGSIPDFHASDAFICKALRGAAVFFLLQAPDNVANGRIRQRPKGENVSAKEEKDQGAKCNMEVVTIILPNLIAL